MTTTVRSPIIWVGGKYYSASRILAVFPPPDYYSTYVEVFGGAGHVLCRKPPYNHVEVYNDINGDLVNFWMHCRDNPLELQRQIDSLPYSRELYYTWHNELFGSPMASDMERAVKWFYVLRNSYGGVLSKKPNGWGYVIQNASASQARRLHTAASLLEAVSERFRNVQIEHQDFAKLITAYDRPTTLFYCDPPYVDKEKYYEYRGAPLFGESDHRRLAALLNKTEAMVALSYYPHPLIDELYPAEKWRRCAWNVNKSIPKATPTRDTVGELLLLNYPDQPV